jgi:hypothetical protein
LEVKRLNSDDIRLNQDQIEKLIDDAISKLVEDFTRVPNKYITEEDVRLHLCSFLLEDFGNEELTQDNDISIPLHCEVRWYGPDKSQERTDIVIFDVSGLTVTKEQVRQLFHFGSIPRKGYAASRPIAAIELKLRRCDGTGDECFERLVMADIVKLNRMKSMMGNHYESELVCRVIALDKKEEIALWNNPSPEVKLVYQFSNRTKNC